MDTSAAERNELERRRAAIAGMLRDVYLLSDATTPKDFQVALGYEGQDSDIARKQLGGRLVSARFVGFVVDYMDAHGIAGSERLVPFSDKLPEKERQGLFAAPMDQDAAWALADRHGVKRYRDLRDKKGLEWTGLLGYSDPRTEPSASAASDVVVAADPSLVPSSSAAPQGEDEAERPADQLSTSSLLVAPAPTTARDGDSEQDARPAVSLATGSAAAGEGSKEQALDARAKRSRWPLALVLVAAVALVVVLATGALNGSSPDGDSPSAAAPSVPSGARRPATPTVTTPNTKPGKSKTPPKDIKKSAAASGDGDAASALPASDSPAGSGIAPTPIASGAWTGASASSGGAGTGKRGSGGGSSSGDESPEEGSAPPPSE